jgi:hypothetical protein
LRQARVVVEMYMVEFGNYPKSLDMLIRERFMFKIPDPIDGKWLYDPKTGIVKHSLIDSDEKYRYKPLFSPPRVFGFRVGWINFSAFVSVKKSRPFFLKK